jgi:hypothetical protein
MRLFQNYGGFPAYFSHRRQGRKEDAAFMSEVARYLDSRYGAVHTLAPVLNGEDTAFFTYGDDEALQRAWAREIGMGANVDLTEILIAQVEHQCTEVFYNLDPVRYGSDFVRRLPGCVKKAVAWRAAPSPEADFGAYDLVVSNFPSILKGYEERGWKAAYFSPSHDPAMDEYAKNDDRPIDVLFVGGYSRHHMRRAAVLEAVARLKDRYRIKFCLACSQFTRLAESPLARLVPLGKYRRPRDIRSVAEEPVYGRDLYALISRSKIVLNGAIDMSGYERGNMRCFEAMGCRSLLLSDEGVYPEGMVAGKTMMTYRSSGDVVAQVEELLRAPHTIAGIADEGYKMIASRYSKERQWSEFKRLVGNI